MVDAHLPLLPRMQSVLQNTGIVPDVVDGVELAEAVEFAVKYPKHEVGCPA